MARNPFIDDDVDDEEDMGSENASFKQLRDYARKLEKENKSFEKELTALREFKAESDIKARQAHVSSVFKEVGLSEKHGALFARVSPDGEVTRETVLAFAQEYELPMSERSEATSSQEASPAPTDGDIVELVQPAANQQSAGFAPTAPSGAPTGSVVTDFQEAVKLMTTNPQEYMRLREAGRIKLEGLPGGKEPNLPGTG
jgi:hypothetical protein